MKILKDATDFDPTIVIERDDKSIVKVGSEYVSVREWGKEVIVDKLGLTVNYSRPKRLRSMYWSDFETMNEALYKIFRKE